MRKDFINEINIKYGANQDSLQYYLDRLDYVFLDKIYFILA